MTLKLVSLPGKIGWGVINRRLPAERGRLFIVVINPATRDVVASVSIVSSSNAVAAIEDVRVALPSWKGRTAVERSRLLERWFNFIEQSANRIATVIVMKHRKPLSEALSEVTYAASFVKFFAEEAKRLYSETIPSTSGDKQNILTKKAIGVCAAITPWKFPAAMVTRKAACALTAGCTIFIKPSEFTQFTALLLAELAHEAGIPAGVLDVIVGDAVEINDVLNASPAVQMLSFTGSTRVGQLLITEFVPTVKKSGLELGENAPFIVFYEADLDSAVEGAMASKFRNAGQTCMCANRICVQAGVYNEVSSKPMAWVESLQSGFGLTENLTQGPLVNEGARQKALSHIDDALKHGVRLATGGRPTGGPGHFIEPTVCLLHKQQMMYVQEETFGPVAPLVRFDTEQQAIDLTNSTEFGLASYFFSQDVPRCFRVSEAIESGMVGVSTGLISSEVVPFGGVKQWGLGR
jgi:succinate-semialdehyde dehydrogenase/glutarate-semialdehyde dehydrogenase